MKNNICVHTNIINLRKKTGCPKKPLNVKISCLSQSFEKNSILSYVPKKITSLTNFAKLLVRKSIWLLIFFIFLMLFWLLIWHFNFEFLALKNVEIKDKIGQPILEFKHSFRKYHLVFFERFFLFLFVFVLAEPFYLCRSFVKNRRESLNIVNLLT